MPYGKGTYGSKKGRPSKAAKKAGRKLDGLSISHFIFCECLLTLAEVTKESSLTGITFTTVVNRKHHHHSIGNSHI